METFEGKISDPLMTLLKQHFEDDRANFKEIRSHMEKHEELTRINGEHMSAIGSELKQVKDLLVCLKESDDRQDKTLATHIERVEPMLLSFESRKTFFKEARTFGESVVTGAKILGAIGVIGSAITYTIKKFLWP